MIKRQYLRLVLDAETSLGGRWVSSVLVRRRQGSIREAWTGEPPRRPRPAKFKVQPAGEATRLELGFGEGLGWFKW